MTLPEFERNFLALYEDLIQSARRKGEDGVAAIHDVYVAVRDQSLYRAISRSKKKTRLWLVRKVWKQMRKGRETEKREYGERRINEKD